MYPSSWGDNDEGTVTFNDAVMLARSLKKLTPEMEAELKALGKFE